MIDETFMVKAGGLVLRIKVIEDTQGPLRMCASKGVASDADSLSSSEEVGEDCVDVDCDLEAEEMVGASGMMVGGMLGSKGVEVGTSLSSISGEGAADMVLEENSSDSHLHGISIPIVLKSQEFSDESKGGGDSC